MRTLINAILGCDVLCRVSRYIYLSNVIHMCVPSEFTSVSMLSIIVARPRRADYVLICNILCVVFMYSNQHCTSSGSPSFSRPESIMYFSIALSMRIDIHFCG